MKILVAPGIGDIHWVLVKLRAFARQRGCERPEITVWDFDGRPRGVDFLGLIPWVRVGEPDRTPLNNMTLLPFRKCYMLGHADVIPGFLGYDYFICPNGSLRNGRRLDCDILPECAPEWRYPILRTEDEVAFQEQHSKAGRYVMLYFSDHGMFGGHWLRPWPLATIVDFVCALDTLLPGCRICLTGAGWDCNFNTRLHLECQRRGIWVENWCGQTSIQELLGMIRGSAGFAGWCGGNTIMSAALVRKTYILWSSYFQQGMYTSWCDPRAIGAWYHWDQVEHVTAKRAATRFANIVRMGNA